MHFVGIVHETLARVLYVASRGAGVGSMVHLVPLQPSASVALPTAVPTAVHEVSVAQETLESAATLQAAISDAHE
jgi:hypothetical protein